MRYVVRAPVVDTDARRTVAELREKGHVERDGDDAAFLRRARSRDDLAEELGEEAVGAMTSGEDQGEDHLDQIVDEEDGAPFVETSGEEEFAAGTDASNPEDATREPFPTTTWSTPTPWRSASAARSERA